MCDIVGMRQCRICQCCLGERPVTNFYTWTKSDRTKPPVGNIGCRATVILSVIKNRHHVQARLVHTNLKTSIRSMSICPRKCVISFIQTLKNLINHGMETLLSRHHCITAKPGGLAVSCQLIVFYTKTLFINYKQLKCLQSIQTFISCVLTFDSTTKFMFL